MQIALSCVLCPLRVLGFHHHSVPPQASDGVDQQLAEIRRSHLPFHPDRHKKRGEMAELARAHTGASGPCGAEE